MDRHHRRGGSRRLLTRVVGLASLTAAFAGASAAPALADLTITKTGPTEAVAQGAQFDYAISVTNSGGAAATATGVTVTDVLPPQVSFVSLGSSLGCSEVTGTVTCTLPDLAPGASAPVTLRVTADDLGITTNTASVASTPADSPTENNSATAVTDITDQTAPQTSIDTAPPALTNSRSATFTFSSSEPGGTFACTLDGAATPCASSPVTLTNLTDGSHTFTVAARDAADNPDPSAASHTWTVDATPPETTIVTSPNDPAASTSATFTLASTESPPAFECTLDGATVPDCPSETNLSGLEQGSHTFTAAARDAAGNVDPSPAIRTWYVDTVAPVVAVTQVAPTNSRTPTLTGTAGDAFGDSATITVMVYRGSGVTGELVQTLTPSRTGTAFSAPITASLADGTYTAVATQTDHVNLTGTSTPMQFIVDTVAPVIRSAAPGNGSATNDTTPAFSGTAGNLAGDNPSVSVAIHAGPSATGTPAQTVTAPRTGTTFTGDATTLPEGVYTARYRQLDHAGNLGEGNDVTFTVDTTAPTNTITVEPPPVARAGSIRFEFTTNEPVGATFACSLDGAAAACTSPHTVTVPDAGSHTFTVQATDRALNVSAAPATHVFAVDAAAPVVTLERPAAGDQLTTRSPVFSGAAGAMPGDHGTVQVEVFQGTSVDNARQALLSTERTGDRWQVTAAAPNQLPDGRYTARARQSDDAGFGFSAPVTFVIDTAAPETAITDGPPSLIHARAARFAFTSDEVGADFECRLDGAAFAPCASPHTVDGMADGAHTFEVRAIDALGNGDASPAAHRFSVDLSPLPVAPAAPPPPAPELTGSSATAKFATKLEILRSRVLRRERKLDVLAPLSRRAGGEADISFQAAGETIRFSQTPRNGQLRFQRAISAAQARLGTGILTIRYAGDEDTRGEEIRLRAASRAARLDAGRPQIRNGRLTAKGLISPLARGVVRIRLDYVSGGESHAPEFTAPIANGRYALDVALPAAVRDGIANREGTVHSSTFFTGYQARRLRGEMASLEVLPFR